MFHPTGWYEVMKDHHEDALVRYVAIGELPEKARVCIYGAGSGGKSVFKALSRQRPHFEIAAFADSFKAGYFLGKPILSPALLRSQASDYDLILVASHAAGAIWRDLMRLGISNMLAISTFHLDYYCFTELDLEKRASDIARISQSLATDDDRDLFELLIALRSVNSSEVIFVSDSEGCAYITPRDPAIFTRQFPAHTRNCYFDFCDLSRVRVSVQGGVYGGYEAIHVLDNAPDLVTLYGFEPQAETCLNPKPAARLADDSRFELVPLGLWHEKASLAFINSNAGSYLRDVSMNQEEGSVIQVTDLDSFLDGRNSPPLDFFFCDIENAELPCLHGMRKRLLSDRPQLAVSIYHSKEQFLDVPLFLITLLEDYDLHIGHYASTLNETTFYAIPKEISRGRME
jgi:FkbM family methyltransferase